MLARKALAGTAGAPKLYVEDVFSTYLYTGTGSSQTITNNIDISGKGGLVWIKGRSGATGHRLTDTVRGATKSLESNSTAAEATESTGLTAFSGTGFTIGADADYNTNAATYASWTFRKAEKFFDVVTYTGNNTSSRAITHNLGSTPGAIFIKKTSAAKNWAVYHRSSDILCLNSTAAAGGIWSGDITSVNSASFTVENYGLNDNGDTYVAYLFAHDAGGFGDAGSDSIIKCGSFTTDGSGNATVDLGWEPQWLLLKLTDTTSAWFLTDNMRGLTVSGYQLFTANTSNAESSGTAWKINSTGFTYENAAQTNKTLIYIAIRRGPMKTPTTGTSVFSPQAYTGDAVANRNITTGFSVDMLWGKDRTQVQNNALFDRLRGLYDLSTNSTAAESDRTDQSRIYGFDVQNGILLGSNDQFNGLNKSNYFISFKRAPGFFDVVCYTGTGANRTVTHNLGVVPELMILKSRTASAAFPWTVYVSSIGTDGYVILDSSDAATTGVGSSLWNSTAPTSLVFSLGTANQININTDNFVAYLFASLSGVSKVGSYTGNGSSVTVTTNFQPRFILVKRTDSTGDWIVSDSARGLVAGNDPYLLLNSTAAEDTDEDWVDISSTSFTVNQTTNNANVNTGTYLYLAIA